MEIVEISDDTIITNRDVVVENEGTISNNVSIHKG
jgi:hypothetical protein